MRPRRLLTIGHSYCVALNRALIDEIARAAEPDSEVTVVAPRLFRDGLRTVRVESSLNQAYNLEIVNAYCSAIVHAMFYGLRLRQILKYPWDFVHCWEEPYILASAQIAHWKHENTSLVYGTFQNIAKQYPPPFNWIERYSMTKAVGWIAFGRTVEQALITKPIYLARPRRVIPSGVDLNRFFRSQVISDQTRHSLGWSTSGAPVVGFLGRFVSEKGVTFLTQTLERVKSPWRALFVGAGPLEGYLKDWGRNFGDRVRIMTRVSHGGVPAFLNAMDILCAPSQTRQNWREQFGRMLIEAFACGVPVIASDSGEIPYTVGDAGLVIGERDQDGWIKALTEFLENPVKRTEYSARGIDRAKTHFALPIVASQYLKFFKEL